MKNVFSPVLLFAFLLLPSALAVGETIRVSRGGFSFDRPVGAQGIVTQTMSTGVITESSEPYNLMIPAGVGSSVEVYAVTVPGLEELEFEVLSQKVVGHRPTLDEFSKEIEAEFDAKPKKTTLAGLPALKFSGTYEISIFGEDPTVMNVFGYAMVKGERLFMISVTGMGAKVTESQTKAIQQLLASFTILD